MWQYSRCKFVLNMTQEVSSQSQRSNCGGKHVGGNSRPLRLQREGAGAPKAIAKRGLWGDEEVSLFLHMGNRCTWLNRSKNYRDKGCISSSLYREVGQEDSNTVSSFLPAAKPTGHRKVRVVVGGGDYFEVMTLKVDLRSRSRSTWPLLIPLSPTHNFLRGGIRRD